MDAKTIEWIIFGPLIAGMFLVTRWAMNESHRRLNDPNDDRMDRLLFRNVFTPPSASRPASLR